MRRFDCFYGIIMMVLAISTISTHIPCIAQKILNADYYDEIHTIGLLATFLNTQHPLKKRISECQRLIDLLKKNGNINPNKRINGYSNHTPVYIEDILNRYLDQSVFLDSPQDAEIIIDFLFKNGINFLGPQPLYTAFKALLSSGTWFHFNKIKELNNLSSQDKYRRAQEVLNDAPISEESFYTTLINQLTDKKYKHFKEIKLKAQQTIDFLTIPYSKEYISMLFNLTEEALIKKIILIANLCIKSHITYGNNSKYLKEHFKHKRIMGALNFSSLKKQESIKEIINVLEKSMDPKKPNYYTPFRMFIEIFKPRFTYKEKNVVKVDYDAIAKIGGNVFNPHAWKNNTDVMIRNALGTGSMPSNTHTSFSSSYLKNKSFKPISY